MSWENLACLISVVKFMTVEKTHVYSTFKDKWKNGKMPRGARYNMIYNI